MTVTARALQGIRGGTFEKISLPKISIPKNSQ